LVELFVSGQFRYAKFTYEDWNKRIIDDGMSCTRGPYVLHLSYIIKSNPSIKNRKQIIELIGHYDGYFKDNEIVYPLGDCSFADHVTLSFEFKNNQLTNYRLNY
jgi:hypothetical protein